MHRLMLFAVGLVLVLATGAVAQEKPVAPSPAEKPGSPSAAREPEGVVPLRVTVVISRFHGDKKISSMPYVLGVAANSAKTTLRMGVEVPVSMGGPTGGGVSYRSVGTTIDCEARSALQPGVYRLFITAVDTSVQLETNETTAASTQNLPRLRSFNTSFVALLRDGQTSQYTSATDPVTGDVMTLDVTLSTMK